MSHSISFLNLSISRNNSNDRISDDNIQDIDRNTQTAIMESINNINYVPNSININHQQSPGNNSNISGSSSYSSSSSSSSSSCSDRKPEATDYDNNECEVVETNRIFTPSCLKMMKPITNKDDYAKPVEEDICAICQESRDVKKWAWNVRCGHQEHNQC